MFLKNKRDPTMNPNDQNTNGAPFTNVPSGGAPMPPNYGAPPMGQNYGVPPAGQAYAAPPMGAPYGAPQAYG